MFPKDSLLDQICLKMKEVGYKRISLCVGHLAGLDKHGSYYGENLPKKNTWPACWGVAEEFKISGGCGNAHQHQLKNVQHFNIFFNSLDDKIKSKYAGLTDKAAFPSEGGLKINLEKYDSNNFSVILTLFGANK